MRFPDNEQMPAPFTLSPTQALQLASQALQTRQFATVEKLCAQILAAEPKHGHALCLLGIAAHQQGQHAAALSFYDRALAVRPEDPEYLCNRGLTLHAIGKLEDAVATYRRALSIDPKRGVVLSNLGAVLCDLGEPAAALTVLQEALAQQPEPANARYNYGNALYALDRLGEAIEAYRQALRREPNNALVFSNLGVALKDHGEIDEAIACLQRSVALAPRSPVLHSKLLAALHYHPRTTLERLCHAHAEFDRLHAAPLRCTAPPTRSDGPIRLGFVSPHFARHPVGRFLIRPLEHLDRTQFSVTCYSDTRNPDAMTDRLRAAAHAWHETAALSDAELTERIRADGLDILFDLAGHTSSHRLSVFARRAAPVQISWLDYVGTTGLAAMDYLLADPREIPPESERWYREKVLRMPHDYICFDPPEDAPPVNALPALAAGHITFGSFNIVSKTTPEIVAVWSRILQRLPGARMVLRNRGFDDVPTAARYRRLFAEHGIAEERLELHGWCPAESLLGHYHCIDLALDTWPYNGGLSTCEALWMGVPVVTCPGETFCSRHGLAHLTAAGWTAGIARDLDDYVERAVALAGDLPRLERTRSDLRGIVQASPLCDGARFAADFAKLLRKVVGRS